MKLEVLGEYQGGFGEPQEGCKWTSLETMKVGFGEPHGVQFNFVGVLQPFEYSPHVDANALIR